MKRRERRRNGMSRFAAANASGAVTASCDAEASVTMRSSRMTVADAMQATHLLPVQLWIGPQDVVA
jgi:hypothetical protein